MTSLKQNQAVILDLAATHQNDLSLASLEKLHLTWQYHQKTQASEVVARIQGKTVVVVNKVVLTREVLQQAKALKLICISATGTNNVDLIAAKDLGISVCNVTAYATASVVQYVFSVLLTLFTRLTEQSAAVKNGQWAKSESFCLLDYPFNEVQGKTLGIVGYGELGKAVATVAKAFGMHVLIAANNMNDSRSGRVPLKTLLSQVDILSLHCPLTAETKNLIAAEELALLPKGAVVINSARGGVVNEADLLAALESGHLGGAATDVLTTEPPPADHLLLQKQMPNLIVTPHIAWASVESRQRLIDQVAANISAFLQAQPRNVVS